MVDLPTTVSILQLARILLQDAQVSVPGNTRQVRSVGCACVGLGSAPTGTVSFLFTDVEGSTRLWEQRPGPMAAALQRHDVLLREAIKLHEGVVFSTVGDAFAAAFASAGDAVAAAVEAQAALGREPWPDGTVVRVRMAVHAGVAVERDGDYFGPVLNRCARLMSIGHGGQILVSDAAKGLLGTSGDVLLVDLGEHRLKDLTAAERVWQVGVEVFPELLSLGRVRSNLPVVPTALIGRADELAAVSALMESSRLVSVVGSGGVGKTRLVTEVAAAVAESFPDGTFFVDLTPVSDDALVAVEIAHTVGIALDGAALGGSSALRHLASVVARRRMLIVLDNCEQVIDGAAEAVDELLHVPDGRAVVLATSREPLDIDGERTFRLDGLAWHSAPGGPPGPAAALLIERARAINDRFDLSHADLAVVAKICESLDGVPLAVELAAAQLLHHSPAELLELMTDRFTLLSSGRRRGDRRHQSLKALMDWSWDLLPKDEQDLLATLSVFAGGFTAKAAADVSGHGPPDTDRQLRNIIAKSLVVAERDRFGSRYRLLETVRAYAHSKLTEPAKAEMAHARWFGRWLSDRSFEDQWASSELVGRLRVEFDNIRTALDRLSAAADDNTTADIVSGCSFLWRSGFAAKEGLEWSSELAAKPLDHDRRARVLLALADARYANGDHDGMRDSARAAAELAVDPVVKAAAFMVMSQGLLVPDPERVVELNGQAEQLARPVGANRVLATAMMMSVTAQRELGVPMNVRRQLINEACALCGPDGWDYSHAHGTRATSPHRTRKPPRRSRSHGNPRRPSGRCWRSWLGGPLVSRSGPRSRRGRGAGATDHLGATSTSSVRRGRQRPGSRRSTARVHTPEHRAR